MINNRYRVSANIGADKSGFFLSLQDTENGKKYYTKLVRIDDAHLSAKALYDLQMRIQRLSRFSHTNVISICESELAPEGMLLRQTELPGYSLKKLMQKNGKSRNNEKKVILLGICIALRFQDGNDFFLEISLNENFTILGGTSNATFGFKQFA